LVGALLVIGSLSGSPEISVVGEEVSAPALPEGLDPIPLTEAERAFARQRGGAIAKGRFRRGDLTGTVVLVRSRSWLAQHLPRHCLRSAGVDVSGEAPVMVDGDPVRWAETTSSVGVGRAAWWFQSGDSRTDDHTERIWMGMGEDRPWTMVSILFDQPLQPDNPEATSIIVQLRALESS
jgi:exosortase O